MRNIRLLPVVMMAIAALLVLKTLGLVTNGGYVLTGVSQVSAAGGGGGAAKPAEGEGASGDVTLSLDQTIEDSAPTLADTAPTLGQDSGGGGHGAPAASSGGDHGGAAPAEGEAAADPAAAGHGDAAAGDAAAADGHGDPAAAAGEGGTEPTNVIAEENACAPRPPAAEGGGGGHGGGDAAAEGSADGQLLVIPADCPLPTDAVPQQLTPEGPVPLSAGGTTLTEQTLLERLAARRTELDTRQQELDMRAALVDAAEKRIEERATTLQTLEQQISALVEQRKQMEEGQFASIVAMYETMKPKDAAAIFNTLDIEILVRVARQMSPRKMAPILAVMETTRAQELTVRLASVADEPADQMTPENLAELPQIVGQ